MSDVLDINVEEILNGFRSIQGNDQRLLLLELLANVLAQQEENQEKQEQQQQEPKEGQEHQQEQEREQEQNNVGLDDATASQLFSTILSFLDNGILSEKRQALRKKLLQTAFIVLTNATKSQHLAELFYSVAQLASPTAACYTYLDTFLAYNPQLELQEEEEEEEGQIEEEDEWQHVGSLVCNLCQVEEGRKIFLKMSDDRMSLLVNQIRSKSLYRRRGAIGAIRSCLFDPSCHWWVVEELNIVPCLCLPLVVGPAFSEKDMDGMDPRLWLQASSSSSPAKPLERNPEIQKMLLDCLLLLCQSRRMRERLRQKKVYPILRNLDLIIEEDQEAISLVILDVVNFLIGDEDPYEMAEEKRKEQEEEEKKGKQLETATAITQLEGEVR